ncbi:Glycosyl transferase family 2 [Poriferisphaera corsica]|uniref:Glycosyl transferase family 2 n=1 Tax=Poriferisphaera corsica TaxID=2528020 RepID=A0A517YT94_9BACT|nr:glycosyltransferase [Poriferisphaera corsica]QDU33434.1 Glycosyl transferase family 2 [Poriferisphaera corsica]
MPLSIDDVTVLICTRNRSNCVIRAIESTLSQKPYPPHIIVLDDFSTDDTVSVIRSQFPQVELLTPDNKQHNYIKHRNDLVKLAQTPIVLLLDDDAYLTDENIVTGALPYFSNLRIAIVGIPCFNPQTNNWEQGSPNTSKQSNPHSPKLLNAYMESTSLYRRDAYLHAQGFREDLAMYTEAADLSTRLFQRGFLIALANTAPINHDPGPRAVTPSSTPQSASTPYSPLWRADLHTRNNFLFTTRYVPFTRIPPVLLNQLKTIYNRYKNINHRRRIPLVLLKSALACLANLPKRKPLSTDQYLRWCHLPRPESTIQALEPHLPPLPDLTPLTPKPAAVST